MRGQNFIKLIKAIELFGKPQGTTLEELAKELKVDRRTAYRWMDIVSELGLPVYDDAPLPAERKKRWKLEDSYLKKLPNLSLPKFDLTLSEVISLYLLKGEEKVYRGTGIEKTIDSAFEKIGALAPDNLLKQLGKIKSLFVPGSKLAKDYSGKEKIINALTEAMLKQKTCMVEYHSFQNDKTKNYEINPLHFFDHHGGLYFFVEVPKYKDIRVLAVERIQELEITEASFVYPENFNPEEMLDPAFGIVYDDPIEVEIWFSKSQAKYIKERKWAKEQKITGRKDGSIVLSMRTSGRDEIKRWVMSYGAEAVVLKPEDLKNEIIVELKEVFQKYKKRT
jgi:predicted DNA-binding transcriptional regulator YafY